MRAKSLRAGVTVAAHFLEKDANRTNKNARRPSSSLTKNREKRSETVHNYLQNGANTAKNRDKRDGAPDRGGTGGSAKYCFFAARADGRRHGAHRPKKNTPPLDKTHALCYNTIGREYLYYTRVKLCVTIGGKRFYV